MMRCRCPEDVSIMKETARVRKQLKEENAAVSRMFRNTLAPSPAPAAGAPAEPAESTVHTASRAAEPQVRDVRGTEVSQIGIFAIISWLWGLLQALLAAAGLRATPTTSTNSSS
jgi:hypothetical protein